MSIALHATHLKQSHVERIMFHSILSFHLVLCPLKSGRAPSSIHWLRHRGKGFVCLCATCLLRTSRVSNLWLAPYKSTLVAEPGPLGSGSNPLPYFHSIYNITIHIDSIFTYPSTSCSSSLAWSLWPKVRRSLTSKMPPQPTPRAAASQASQASQPAAYDGTSLKDTYIPVFDGQPSSYQEWRKRIGIYHLKMKLQKRTAESILNIIGSLQGTAWKLVVTWTRSTKKELLRIWWNFSMMPSGMTAGFVFHRILMPTSLISPGNQVRPCCRTSRSMTRSLGRFKNVESKSLMKPKDGYFSRNPVSPRSNSRWSSPRPRRWRNSGSKKPCFCWVSPGIFFPCPGFFPDLFCFPSPTSILPLPFHAACYLQHFGAGTFHFACSLQHLGAGTFHAACYLQHFGAGTFYFACYLPHLGAGTFHLACYLPHLRAGTFQFACYLQNLGAGTFHFVVFVVVTFVVVMFVDVLSVEKVACSLQPLGAGTFHAACYLQHSGAGTFYSACYLPHLGAGTFHLACYLPHLRAGTFQFACYLQNLGAGTFHFVVFVVVTFVVAMFVVVLSVVVMFVVASLLWLLLRCLLLWCLLLRWLLLWWLLLCLLLWCSLLWSLLLLSLLLLWLLLLLLLDLRKWIATNMYLNDYLYICIYTYTCM